MAVHPGSTTYAFRILVCGSKGGSFARDTSSYLIASHDQPNNFISMDGGTQMDCLPKVLAHDATLHLVDTEKQTELNERMKSDRASLSEIETAKAAVDSARGDAAVETAKTQLKEVYAKKDLTLGAIGYFKKEQINAFMITHGHLDHTAGLVIASAEDKPAPAFNPTNGKPVIGFASVIAGINKQLSKPLWPVNIWYAASAATTLVPKTPKELKAISAKLFKDSTITITAYPLSHGTELSTAFLICNDKCVLYFGDTGPDKYEDVLAGSLYMKFAGLSKEKGDWAALDKMWDWSAIETKFKDKLGDENWKKAEEIRNAHHSKVGITGERFTPLRNVWDADPVKRSIKSGALKTIFLESSYLNGRPPSLLFGHLTPELIGEELQYIAKTLDEAASISLVVTHIKPTWDIADKASEIQSTEYTKTEMNKQLNALLIDGFVKDEEGVKTNLAVEFIIPKQGDMIYAMKGGEATKRVSLETGNAMPLYAPHAPHVHRKHHVRHSRPVYDDYFDALHGVNDYDSSRWIMAEEGVAYVALLAFVITICFILGLVCGAGYEEVKNRITKRAKQDK